MKLKMIKKLGDCCFNPEEVKSKRLPSFGSLHSTMSLMCNRLKTV